MRSRLRVLGVGLVVWVGALVLASPAWAGGTWAYTSADHTQLQINFQTDNSQNAYYEVFTLSVPVLSATCPGGGAGSVAFPPDNNPDEFECQLSPVASSGTVSVTTDPEQCNSNITNQASFDNMTYTAQNPITPVASNCAPPVAAFTASPSPTTVGTSVSFDGTASHDPNSGGSITGYSWNFGDGSAAGSGATVNHSYTSAGTYTVKLTVTDAEGGTNSTTHSVTVTKPGTGGNPPVNTGLPQISGDAIAGETLTASTGTWTGDPTSFAYDWLICDSNGDNCFGAGSTGSSIVPDAVDSGDTFRVVVIATNASGSTPATSAPTQVVTLPPLTVGSASTSGPTATLPVACSAADAAANGNCFLLFLLAALGAGQPTTGHAPDVGMAATCHRTKRHRCPLVVGKTNATIPAGHTKHVRITLNRAGRRLLAKKHTLKVRLTITEKGHTLFTRTIVFKSKKHH